MDRLDDMMNMDFTGKGILDDISGNTDMESKFFKMLIKNCSSHTVITDVKVVMDKNEQAAKNKCPNGYELIASDLNKGAGGQFIYICIRREEILTMKKQ